MKRKTRKIVRRSGQPALVIQGPTPETIRAQVNALRQVLSMKKNSDSVLLASVHALTSAWQSQPITISNCYFENKP